MRVGCFYPIRLLLMQQLCGGVAAGAAPGVAEMAKEVDGAMKAALLPVQQYAGILLL